jgi:LytS/YehU family sensor histidine kinase
LFNALNTLYGTALREGSKLTAEGIQKLGDMMRFMLHENTQDYIAMNREIEYLENFISLQKLRIQSSPGIVIEDTINEKYCNHQIAPMLLIPFIENAFKHGISLTEQSWIKILLTCDEKNIRFEVRNSIHSFRNNDPEREKSGIGLINVAERLKLLYPGRHEFVTMQSGNEFIAQLSIQP